MPCTMLMPRLGSVLYMFGGMLGMLVACSNNAGGEIPGNWMIDYRGKTVSEIQSRIGQPDEIMGAKQYANWIAVTPGGRHVLKVICPARCLPTEVPTEVLFLAYRGDAQTPWRVKKLL